MDVQKTKTLENEDRRPDVENGDLENQDPLKITWKWLETANNYFQTLHECKKQHVFQLFKILTQVFVFQTQKTKIPLKITWKRQSVQQLFPFPFSQAGITCEVLTPPPTPHPSLKIFAPLRCRLLTSLTFSNLHLAERICKYRDISYTPLVSRSRYKQFQVVSK